MNNTNNIKNFKDYDLYSDIIKKDLWKGRDLEDLGRLNLEYNFGDLAMDIKETFLQYKDWIEKKLYEHHHYNDDIFVKGTAYDYCFMKFKPQPHNEIDYNFNIDPIEYISNFICTLLGCDGKYNYSDDPNVGGQYFQKILNERLYRLEIYNNAVYSRFYDRPIDTIKLSNVVYTFGCIHCALHYVEA